MLLCILVVLLVISNVHVYLPVKPCISSDRNLLAGDDYLYVPEVIPDLSTRHVLTTEFVQGMPLDQCVDLDQDMRNKVHFPCLDFGHRVCEEQTFGSVHGP